MRLACITIAGRWRGGIRAFQSTQEAFAGTTEGATSSRGSAPKTVQLESKTITISIQNPGNRLHFRHPMDVQKMKRLWCRIGAVQNPLLDIMLHHDALSPKKPVCIPNMFRHEKFPWKDVFWRRRSSSGVKLPTQTSTAAYWRRRGCGGK